MTMEGDGAVRRSTELPHNWPDWAIQKKKGRRFGFQWIG
jgi:hypothetical protein